MYVLKKTLISIIACSLLILSVGAEEPATEDTEEPLVYNAEEENTVDAGTDTTVVADDENAKDVVDNSADTDNVEASTPENNISSEPAEEVSNIVEDTPTIELGEFKNEVTYNEEHTVATIAVEYLGECTELNLVNEEIIQQMVNTGVYQVNSEKGDWTNKIAFDVLVNGIVPLEINVWNENTLVGTKMVMTSVTGLNNDALIFEPNQSSTYEITSSDVGSTDLRNMTLSYETNVSFTWSIPTELSMAGIEDDLTVTVNNSNLATETVLRIRISSNNDYKLIDSQSSESLSYIVTDLSGNKVNNDDVILDHLYNQDSTSNTIHFNLTQMPLVSGKYNDTLTFTASVERLLSDVYLGQVVTISNLGTTHSLTNMKIYGVSKQDGTPTPDNPVEIQSVVNPTVTVSSGNLYDYGKTDLYNCTYENGVYTTGPLGNYGVISIPLIGDYIFKKGTRYYSYIKVRLKEGTYVGVNYFDPNVDRTEKRFHMPSLTNEFQTYIMEFVPNEDSKADVFYFQIGQTTTWDTIIEVKDIMITTSNPSDYVPYNGEPQTATLNYTLNAIPVDSGGNVTVNGQQYISDYVDIENKKLVRMVDVKELNGTEMWSGNMKWHYTSFLDASSEYSLCRTMTGLNFKEYENYVNNNENYILCVEPHSSVIYVKVTDDYNTPELIKEYFTNNPTKLYYTANTPIVIDLTDVEVQAFKDLYTYLPTTIVSVSSDQLTPYIEFGLS